MSSKPNIVFFGSDAICLPALNYLLQQVEVCTLRAVVSQPDRPQGRGKQLRPNPVAAWALENGIELRQPEKPDAALIEWLSHAQIAVAYVMAYGHFLGKRLREAPTYGMVNFHGSLLPGYRGASPVETAIAEGERETGVCLMQIVREMDAGGVADYEKVVIEPDDTSPLVRAKVGQAVVPLLQRNLSGSLTGNLNFVEQDRSAATFCRKIDKHDGAIDFTLPARVIYNRMRAFNPWPGAYCDHKDVRIKVGRSSWEKNGSDGHPPGEVIANEGFVEVATCDGTIRLYELQRPGGRMLPAREFLRGYPILVGDRLKGGVSRPLLRKQP